MKDVKRWLPGAIVSILLIAVRLYFVDLRAMVDAIRHANYPLLLVGCQSASLADRHRRRLRAWRHGFALLRRRHG